MTKKGLFRYFDIVRGRRLAGNLVAKRVPIGPILAGCSEEMLWDLHGRAMQSFRENGALSVEEQKPELSLLDLKIELSRRIMERCRFCERRCEANRLAGETGHCGVTSSRYSSEFLHWGEEPELVPSHTIFFSGCTFNCVYCQNWEIAGCPGSGRVADAEELARLIEIRHQQGSRNVNFVGGDPTPHLYTVLRMISSMGSSLAMVWNSNMYHSEETTELLKGVIDLYLGDFRYGNDVCASRYSGVENYLAVVSRNFEKAFAEADVILRHLVLPGHVECCTNRVMEWVRSNIPSVYFNLMFQYRPEYKAAQYPEINRLLTVEEKRRALELAEEFGIEA
jgi:putative pyruvate formate lyase activating enzyme